MPQERDEVEVPNLKRVGCRRAVELDAQGASRITVKSTGNWTGVQPLLVAVKVAVANEQFSVHDVPPGLCAESNTLKLDVPVDLALMFILTTSLVSVIL